MSLVIVWHLPFVNTSIIQGDGKPEPKDLWSEPYARASSWTPCAHRHNWRPSGLSHLSLPLCVCVLLCIYLYIYGYVKRLRESSLLSNFYYTMMTNTVISISEGKSGYIMVTANGGINQQRVAVSYDYVEFPGESIFNV